MAQGRQVLRQGVVGGCDVTVTVLLPVYCKAAAHRKRLLCQNASVSLLLLLLHMALHQDHKN